MYKNCTINTAQSNNDETNLTHGSPELAEEESDPQILSDSSMSNHTEQTRHYTMKMCHYNKQISETKLDSFDAMFKDHNNAK